MLLKFIVYLMKIVSKFQQGGKCMVLPSIPQEGIEKVFPKGVTVQPVPSGKAYLRFTPQPE